MFFKIEEKFYIFKNKEILVLISNGDLFEQTHCLNVKDQFQKCVQVQNSIYFTTENSFGLFELQRGEIKEKRYDFPIENFYVNSESKLIVFRKLRKYSIFFTNNTGSFNIEGLADIPYHVDVSKQIFVYFTHKILIYDLDRNLVDSQTSIGLQTIPKTYSMIKAKKMFAISENVAYVTKNGLEWVVYKQNLATDDYDPNLQFVTREYRDCLLWGNKSVSFEYSVEAIIYLNTSYIVLSSNGIFEYSSITNSFDCKFEFADQNDLKRAKLFRDRILTQAEQSFLDVNARKHYIERIIADFIVPSDTNSSKYSNGFFKKAMNLKNFLQAKDTFETVENLTCTKLYLEHELDKSKISRRLTWKEYKCRMDECNQSRERMTERIEKLKSLLTGDHNSKFDEMFDSQKDSLVEDEFSKMLIESQISLATNCMKNLEAEEIMQEKMLLCGFEKINNEVICLEYNSERLRRMIKNFQAFSRCFQDFPIEKVIQLIAKGRPKLKNNNFVMSLNFYDQLEYFTKQFQSLISNKAFLLQIDSNGFKIANVGQKLNYLPADQIVQIQKQIRNLEDQYGADKEEILGLEHSINILDWEYKILAILRDSLKSDYAESSSLKAKRTMIAGFGSPVNIAKATVSNSKPDQLQLWKQFLKQEKKNLKTLKQTISELELKRSVYIERERNIEILSEPSLEVAQVNLGENYALLSKLNERYGELECQFNRARQKLTEIVRKSRPVFE
eukprot:NODE_49_length_31687_cov_0.791123.p5 type:complete len:729 gc:universal NODE_49_length_31687_cov_0.791123:25332-27518(+)